MLVAIRNLPKMDVCYFKRTESAKTMYKINFYDRSLKSYSTSPVDDMNREFWIKRDKPVYIGFEY
tara:strand:+ start:118 stop:312 length:195 start_codon:yes stop_codon:yes gene_type:complete